MTTNPLKWFIFVLFCSTASSYLEIPPTRYEINHVRLVDNPHGHFCKCRLSYYPHSTATFQVLLACGDIEQNPGPLESPNKNCTRPERPPQYGQPTLECLCSTCASRVLPFANNSFSSQCSKSTISSVSNLQSLSDSTLTLNETHSNHNNNSVLLLNAESIGNKIDELTNLIFSLNPKPNIFGISETWLNSNFSDSELTMNSNYRVFRQDRSSRGGGVCLLVSPSLKPRLSCLSSESCELVWVDCQMESCYLKICCYYRPPYWNKNTLPSLSNSIALALRSKCPDGSEPKILVMGDFNVNTLDKSHYLYDDLTDLVSVHNLHQFVNQPTYHKPNMFLHSLIISTVMIRN